MGYSEKDARLQSAGGKKAIMVISGENMKKMANAGQLNLEDGEINFISFRMAMLPAFTWTKLIEEFYKRHGDEAFEMLFEAGQAHGKYAIEELGQKHDIPRRQFLDQALHTADVLGLGKFSLEKLNFGSGEIVFKMENSPFKKEFEDSKILNNLDRSIDDLQLGMAAAISKRVLEGEVEAKETECTFRGDPHCRFVVKRK